jgi:hypothetical protein
VASLRDVSLAEAGKYGSLTDYAFFDKVRIEETIFPLVNLGIALLHYCRKSWKEFVIPFKCSCGTNALFWF